MGSGIRFGFGVVFCVLSVFAKAGDMPAATGGDAHAVAQTGAGNEVQQASFDEKVPLKVTPVTAWDPNMVLTPGNPKEGVRLFLAWARSEIDKIKASKIPQEDKDKQIKIMENMMKASMVAFHSVSDYSKVSSALFICAGGEMPLPLNYVLPMKPVKTTVGGGLFCAVLAFSKDAGSESSDGFMIGLGSWVGVQGTYNWAADQASGHVGEIEFQASGGGFFPLNGQAPVLRVGDLQGYYAGGGIELTTPSFNALRNGRVSGSLSAYAKIDGLHKPDVAMIMGVVGRTTHKSFPVKGEALYFSTPYATDGTTFRLPTVPFTDISLTEGSAKSKHAPQERLKEISSKEVLEMIQAAKPRLEQMSQGGSVAEVIEARPSK